MRTDCNQLASITFSERRCFFFAALLVLFRFRLDRFVFFVLSLGAAAAMTPTPFSALPVFFACFFPFSFIFFTLETETRPLVLTVGFIARDSIFSLRNQSVLT